MQVTGSKLQVKMPSKQKIEDRILYEDNHLLIVNKLPSEIVQGDKTGDEPLSEMLKYYLKKKYNKPGNVFLGVTHRIDRPTSGAVIFARTSKALSRSNKMLQDGSIKKTYWAVVRNKPPQKEDHLVHWLVKDEGRNKSFVVDENKLTVDSRQLTRGAKRAEMKYRVIGASDQYYLLEVELLTGRHHQIRAQLSAIGCPIKGDLKYGFPRSNKDASIQLHARHIEFEHPVKKEPVIIHADPPKEALWDYFLKNFRQ